MERCLGGKFLLAGAAFVSVIWRQLSPSFIARWLLICGFGACFFGMLWIIRCFRTALLAFWMGGWKLESGNRDKRLKCCCGYVSFGFFGVTATIGLPRMGANSS